MWKLSPLVVVVASACGHKTEPPVAPPPSTPQESGAPYASNDLPLGLDVRLSDGTQGAPAADHSKPTGKPISDTLLAPLFARMKPLAAQTGDTTSFALRPGSQPPPRTSQTIHDSFPPPASSLLPPPAKSTGELHVLRFMPEGPVALAPQLSITFDQPMVAVTSQTGAASVQPVKLVPQPKGAWRWIGTRTIVFDPDVRFPQATTYRVEIAAGTKSATGGVLSHGVGFTFETPPPSLIAHEPSSGPQRLDVAMLATFDQNIDPRTALASAHAIVTQHGHHAETVELRLLTAAEIAKSFASLATNNHPDYPDGRWIAFRATEPLPTDAQIEIAFGSGLGSLEGPNKTKAPQQFSFRTYAPFRLDRTDCTTECSPGMPLELVLDNPIDVTSFDPSLVTVTPEIPGMHIYAAGTELEIAGETNARTSYQVKVSRKLADVFGQTLGKDLDVKFDVGNAQPTFYGPNDMVVLDPAAPSPVLDFFTTNYEQLKVRLYRVTPADYPAYETYLENRWNHDHPTPPPGNLVLDTSIATTHGANQLVETKLELAAALHFQHGDVVAIVEPSPWHGSGVPPRLIAWVQSTKLGIDAHVDGDSLVAYASDLVTGKPLANVAVELEPGDVEAATDAQGIATLPVPKSSTDRPSTLVATLGSDHAFLAGNRGMWSDHTPPDRLAWYVADDRNMYRPGETVSLKGWLRELEPGKHGDLGPIDASVTEVAYRVIDSQSNELLKGTAKVDALGGWDTQFVLPKTPNLGYTRVELIARGETYYHDLHIEEFRRPEFEVSAHAGAGPYLVAGTGADVTVDAKYYSGGPLGGAKVQWTVVASPSSYTPPNRDGYIFGTWTPWWGAYGYEGDAQADPNVKRTPGRWSHESKTDATGEHVLHVDFASVNPATPMTVLAEASVTDVNRQRWSASTSLLVHPSSYYVGVKTKQTFVTPDKPFDIDVVGVDIDGKAVPGAKISVRSVRLDWTFDHGVYRTKELDPQTCDVVAAVDPQPCHFATKVGGTYRLVATIEDARHRPNRTELTYWVAGGASRPAAGNVARQAVTLIPDKKDYAVGDTAQILVDAPFYPAEAVISWRRSGIVKLQRMTLTAPGTVLKVPIDESLVPNVFVHVDAVGQTQRVDDHGDPDPKAPLRPAYAMGELDLSIPAKTRTLGVTITPAAPKVTPGADTSLAVKVVDANGKPVANAEVAVIAVDESVLALSGYDLPDPIAEFYGPRASGVDDYFSRSYVRIGRREWGVGGGYGRYRGISGRGHGFSQNEISDGEFDEQTRSLDLGGNADSPMFELNGKVGYKDRDDADKNEAAKEPMERRAEAIDNARESGILGGVTSLEQSAPRPIAIRSNFNPLAAFAPAVTTGADGTTHVAIKMPDNLTRYRLVAIAAAGRHDFGKGESTVTARLPLMVRPSPPRFLNFGDTFRLPVTIQNQTDAPMTVRVAVRATNATLTEGSGREVVVAPNDRALVEFPMAAELAGTARLQLVASSGTASDAAELSLPVWTPATTEAFATYGVIDTGAVAQPVALPAKVVPNFGGLEVTTASTNLASLTDALLYLVHYPFECAEQRSSRIVAIAALRDVLTAFHTKDMPSKAELEASMADDIEHLANMQNSDGGFAFWDRGEPSEPYLSVFVVNALARAKAKGFAIPPALFQNAAPYLATIEDHIPSSYGRDLRLSISAYALATRKLTGNLDLGKAQRLFHDNAGPDKLPIEADGWLLDVFAGNPKVAAERAAIVRYAENHASETAGAANFTTGYSDGGHLLLASDARVDGVMLEALISEQKDNDLIPKVVTGLLAHRRAGRWDSTQENSFALVALDLYFRTYENVTPDFVARVWLGNDSAGDHPFKGRTTENHEVDIAMADVATHDHEALTIAKDGAGRLYYRVAMTYAPANLKLAPADYGFTVARHYEAVDDPKDVTLAADGTWHVKAGARVRVRVSMVNDNRRYQVALVDPMPAGFEAMNPDLAVTGSIPADPNATRPGNDWWWTSSWYEHQQLRDERAEAFASLLWEGVHEYTYVARATTPGNFVVPPPKAEEMYMPETFGRGASDRVVIE